MSGIRSWTAARGGGGNGRGGYTQSQGGAVSNRRAQRLLQARRCQCVVSSYPTERDGKTAPRLSPTFHPQHPHHSSFVIPRRPLCVVRMAFSYWSVWFEAHEEVAEHATGEDGHQQPSEKVGTRAKGGYTLSEVTYL